MRVLAAIDNSPTARTVLEAAAGVTVLFDAELEAVHVREDGDQTARGAAEAAGVELRSAPAPAVEGLIQAGEAEDVVAMVVGARSLPVGRRPAGRTALRLAVAVRKPLVVVPPEAPTPLVLRRVLVPLDGSRATAAALAETLKFACRAELEILVLHVHAVGELPLFSDQPHHELDAWAEEFLRRHCPEPRRVRLETRFGAPGEHVLRVAQEEQVDLIALGWSQSLAAGRAAVIRETLERSRVPVLLVPLRRR